MNRSGIRRVFARQIREREKEGGKKGQKDRRMEGREREGGRERNFNMLSHGHSKFTLFCFI